MPKASSYPWSGGKAEWVERVKKARDIKYATGIENKEKLEKDELLIYGFMREIENCKLLDTIIPSSINSIFLQFYHVPLENKEEILTYAVRRLVKIELRDVSKHSEFSGGPDGDDIFSWNISFDGPKDSLYEGGRFNLDIKVPMQYPFHPPKVKFVTRIYHCNISKGKICLNLLGDHWWPGLTINKILLAIRDLLRTPEPDDTMEDDPFIEEICKLYLEDKDAYNKNAREWTKKYAQ